MISYLTDVRVLVSVPIGDVVMGRIRIFCGLVLNVVAAFVVFDGAFSTALAQQSFQLKAPAGWGGETIRLPPGFAPAMTLVGEEHIRFAPGMMKADAADFFSYAFAFELGRLPELSEEVVHRELLAYYRGLCQAVAGKKLPDLDVSRFRLRLTAVKSDAAGVDRPTDLREALRYEGVLEWIEPFRTLKPQALNLEVQTWNARGKSYLFACVSPAIKSAAVWTQLRDIQSGYLSGGDASLSDSAQ